MCNFRKLGMVVAVLALSAIGAANASAASFTASATGELSGEALEKQVFTTAAGTVECTGADVTGTIVATASEEQDVEVELTGCKAFGVATVHISKQKYKYTANGEFHIKSPITITVTRTLFTAHCSQVFPAQTAGELHYVNSNGMTDIVPTVTELEYTSTGGICGTAGTHTDGTYFGKTTVKRVGGGTTSFDP